MANTTRSAGLGANGVGGGSATWTNPNNITASDNTRAVIQGPDGFSSRDLVCSNFNFNIPLGSTINGISVGVERYASGQVIDTVIKLLNGDGAGGESNYNDSSGATWSATDATTTFGGPTQTWGESWTAAKINSSNFGVILRCEGVTGDYAVDQAYIDHVQITVYFSSTIRAGVSEIKEIRVGANPISNITAGSITI
jgi:hypothetical protein